MQNSAIRNSCWKIFIQDVSTILLTDEKIFKAITANRKQIYTATMKKDVTTKRLRTQSAFSSWPWLWPWIGSYCIPLCITHRPLPTYQMSLKSKKLFVDGRADGHLRPALLGRLGGVIVADADAAAAAAISCIFTVRNSRHGTFVSCVYGVRCIKRVNVNNRKQTIQRKTRKKVHYISSCQKSHWVNVI